MQLPSHVSTNLLLIKTDGAHTIAFCPEMSPQLAPFQLLIHIEYLYGAFTLEESYGF
jgi:hypothetical protein